MNRDISVNVWVHGSELSLFRSSLQWGIDVDSSYKPHCNYNVLRATKLAIPRELQRRVVTSAIALYKHSVSTLRNWSVTVAENPDCEREVPQDCMCSAPYSHVGQSVKEVAASSTYSFTIFSCFPLHNWWPCQVEALRCNINTCHISTALWARVLTHVSVGLVSFCSNIIWVKFHWSINNREPSW